MVEWAYVRIKPSATNVGETQMGRMLHDCLITLVPLKPLLNAILGIRISQETASR